MALFKPGQSGNPSGRKPVDPKIKAMFDALLPKAIIAIENGLTDPDPRIRIKAAEISLDRALGKPHQAMDLDIDASSPLIAIIKEAKQSA